MVPWFSFNYLLPQVRPYVSGNVNPLFFQQWSAEKLSLSQSGHSIHLGIGIGSKMSQWPQSDARGTVAGSFWKRSFLILRRESMKEMSFFLWMLGVLLWHLEVPRWGKPTWEWNHHGVGGKPSQGNQRKVKPERPVTNPDASSTPGLPLQWANHFIIV